MRKTITLAVVATLLATTTQAHDWYPIACCSDNDCAPVPQDAWWYDGDWVVIQVTPETFRHTETGEPLTDRSVQLRFRADSVMASQDGQPHVCMGQAHRFGRGLTNGGYKPLCAFLPMAY